MSDRSRIPNTIGGFNDYINNSDDRLQAISSGIIHNWERLGLTSDNATDWHDKRVYWRDTLYPAYSNPLTSNSAIKSEVATFMDDFREFGNPLLNIMAANPAATAADELVFNFKIGRANPTHPTTPIEEHVVYDVEHMGGGDLKFSCRTSHDDHRASKPEDADAVMMAWQMQEKDKPEEGEETEFDPDTMSHEIFTKAVFTKHMGAVNIGKQVIIFLRWVNTKHPELAGSWSPIRAIVIA